MTTTSTRRAVARAAVIAAATSLAALTLASPASADSVALDRDLQRSGCNGAPQFCGKPVVLQFTNTTPTVAATVTDIVGNMVECPKIAVTAKFDGGNTTHFFPASNGSPVALTPGSHTVALDGVCQEGVSFTHWGAHIQISNVGSPAAPAGQGSSTATVTADVDHYNGPNGTGGTNDFLPVGKTVKVAAPCTPDAWCNLIDPPGSAWGQFLKNN
jgi:hypothetical protein